MSDLVERLQAASRDDRLADGMLYRKAADRIEELEAENLKLMRDSLELWELKSALATVFSHTEEKENE